METDKVLVVEDEPDIRSGIVELLRDKFTVYEAANGAEALEKTKKVFPYLQTGIVLLDIRLPDISGMEVLKKIKEHDPLISVIMVTALKDTRLAVEALNEGASDYVTKPFSGEEIVVKMKHSLDQNELTRKILWLYQRIDKRINMQLLQVKLEQEAEKDSSQNPIFEDLKDIIKLGENVNYGMYSYLEIEKALYEKAGKKVDMSGKKARVLIVDDEQDIRDGIVALLSDRYEVKSASDGKSAMEVFKKDEFDAVLLDIRLPDINGIELLKKFIAEDKNIYVIMVTALKDISITVEAIKAGASDYMTKPFASADLIQIIDRQINLKNSRLRIEKFKNDIENELAAKK